MPTTIGDMTWGVAFFQRDRMFSFHDAVVTGSLVPLGWVIGCPLLGWLADQIGRRKPVLIGGAAAMLLSAAGIAFSTSTSPLNRLPGLWDCLGRGDDSIHDRQGGQSGRSEGQCDWRDQLPHVRSHRTCWTHLCRLVRQRYREHAKPCRAFSRRRPVLDVQNPTRDPAERISARDRARARKGYDPGLSI